MTRHRTAFAVAALAATALDLWTKHLVFRAIPEGGAEVPVIDGLFSYGRTTNPGIVFGMFPGARQIFLVVSVLAVPAILAIFLSLRKPHWIVTASLALILGGTLGNMADRILVGEVRDFIKFHWNGRVWPLFNLADSYICVGVALLSLEMLLFDEKKKPAAADPGNSTQAIAAGPTEPMPRADAPENPDAPKVPGAAPAPPGPGA